MKQRVVAGALLIAAIFVFVGTLSGGQIQGIRGEAPSQHQIGEQFYYDSEINPFYPRMAPYYKLKGGYITGNCTWYAWGRACEIAGGKLPYVFTGTPEPGGKKIRKKSGTPGESSRNGELSPATLPMWR